MNYALPIIVAIGGIALLAMAGKRIVRREQNSVMPLFTAIIAILWAAMRITQGGFPQLIDPQMTPYFEHYAAMLSGAGITLAVILVIQSNRAKTKRSIEQGGPGYPPQGVGSPDP
jgi:uncharacterized membrane protein YoaK (UPF0700 family)